MNLQFPEHIHHLLIDGEFTLLDVRADKYYLLGEPESAALLDGIIRNERNEIVEKLLAEGMLILLEGKAKVKSVEAGRLGVGNHEWRSVIDHRRAKFDSAQLVFAVLLLIYTKAFMTIFGLKGIVNRCRKISEKMPATSDNVEFKKKKMEAMAGAIFSAGLLLPFRVQCLESSFALFIFSHLIGIRARLRIGVQRYDFLSHAWIEINGCVVGDIPSLNAALPVILEV